MTPKIVKGITIPGREKSESSLVQIYSRLLLWVGVCGIASAGLLWLIGQPGAALGTLAATPAAMFNHWFLAKILAEPGVETKRIVVRTLLRTAIACTALFIGAQFGVDVMLGVLLGLNIEVLTYFGEALWAILRRGSA